jgi:hypothetical protein
MVVWQRLSRQNIDAWASVPAPFIDGPKAGPRAAATRV